jgi:predicted Zn-dependent protease
MKLWLPFALIVCVAVAALVISERQALRITIGPRALMYWLGDTQREATRIPARLVRLSDVHEIMFGDGIAQQYASWSADRRSADDAAMQSYVESIGARLAAHATRKLPYRFHYIADRSFENAFALPGGHVFIGSGLIAHMETEDELSSVLGHEIEHIDRYHCSERAQIEAAARHLGIAGMIAALPIELFVAGYNKQQEFEADTEGVRLAVLSGYSPYGARDLMKRFAQLDRESPARPAATPVGEVARVPLQTLSDYFRSHPPSAERAAAIDALIAREHWQSRRTQTTLRLNGTEREISRGQ